MRQFIKKEQGNALILGAVSFAVLTCEAVALNVLPRYSDVPLRKMTL